MKDLPLRRGQIITTFGPGSLVVSPEGETAIVGALDKWYYNKDDIPLISLGEYEVHEPRLKSLLGVNKFLAPPDYRPSYQFKGNDEVITQTNTDVYIPLLRYPSWHYCPYCRYLYQRPLTSKTGWADCNECKKQVKMIQAPFVVVCNHGHLSDFPWREWTHHDENTSCNKKMKLVSTGGATLDSLKVVCDCDQERSLRGIMSNRKASESDKGASELSLSLNKKKGDKKEVKNFMCPGTKPWMGSTEEKENCSAYPIAVLKNSINAYYSNTISAIYLPGENKEVDELVNIFEKYKISTQILDTHNTMDAKIEFVKMIGPPEITGYKNKDIEQAILYLKYGNKNQEDTSAVQSVEQELRRKEFEILIEEVDSPSLKIIEDWSNDHVKNSKFEISSYFEKINRITKLKETIVLTGFTRLNSNTEESKKISSIHQGKALLFKDPSLPENDWLPAYKVFGEGIFFTLDKDKLNFWENQHNVRAYFQKYLNRHNQYADQLSSDTSPRYILLHTLSHIIIDQLALTCGYNTTSLKERLYLEPEQSGVLIYTSSGDTDGTFGGLVRMGKSEKFFPLVHSAITKSEWCSSDPVCSEIGISEGQGLNKLNGAACHSCSYLPETSCELWNLYLDRTWLIDEEIGFFKQTTFV
ncbi:DUF1998 domain-containing protein [Priestia endophytica]|uniref:DUF1998 domain-containing protein n=1 Tax=Priestia endophytica TaxID=135735 RepID=UPI000DCA9157|nr:DUF1998 domain-containing protein [Priestia endophytica]RAS80761.1 hypothetical protein A4U60_14390 [Priestia endophytica]